MKYMMLVAILAGAFQADTALGDDHIERCPGILRAEFFGQMSREALAVHREQVNLQTPRPAAEAVCESTAAVTYDRYKSLLELARQESLKAGHSEFDPAELYFFLECGEEQVGLSPLAYHAFNLNRDENGFVGELTLAIAWTSVGYLDIKDPTRNRSFMESVDRILTYARNNDSQTEIEMYEDLLLEINGFREDCVQ